MDMQPITIKSTLLKAMISHAIKELPNECCGVFVGRSGKIERVIPMASTHPSPDAYSMSPEEQVQIYTEMEQQGEQLLGIYHSHPQGPASPSSTDIRLAFHPDVLYFIIILKDKKNPEVRAFRIISQEVTEIPIEINPE